MAKTAKQAAWMKQAAPYKHREEALLRPQAEGKGWQNGLRTVSGADDIASKVATDLKRLQLFYGRGVPTDEQIEDFQKEIMLFLLYRYLGEITYGFKRGEEWGFALRYKLVNGDPADSGDTSGAGGRFDISAADSGSYLSYISEADFGSYLSYSVNWRRQTNADRENFASQLPFQRYSGGEPKIENGCWVNDRIYISGDVRIRRAIIERGH